jgi:hypothetical protein
VKNEFRKFAAAVVLGLTVVQGSAMVSGLPVTSIAEAADVWVGGSGSWAYYVGDIYWSDSYHVDLTAKSVNTKFGDKRVWHYHYFYDNGNWYCLDKDRTWNKAWVVEEADDPFFMYALKVRDGEA